MPGQIQYYLNVDLIVHEDKHEEFERLMKKLLGQLDIFKGWTPRLTLRSLEPYELWALDSRALPVPDREQPEKTRKSPEQYAKNFELIDNAIGTAHAAQDRFYRYLHLWSIPDPSAIAEMMTRFGENQTYQALDVIVEREVQQLLFWVQNDGLPPAPEKPPSDTSIYVYVQRELPANKVTEYLYSAIPAVTAIEHDGKNSWKSCGFFRHATGPLNHVTEFWQTPMTRGEFKTLVDKGPSKQLPHTSESWTAKMTQFAKTKQIGADANAAAPNSDAPDSDFHLLTATARQEMHAPMTVVNYF